jgi:anti-sigma regulatory factor (Ser/Thr protein kinase)
MYEPTATQPGTPQGVLLEIPAGADAPARARAALAPVAGVVDRSCLDRLELVVSELVTNAVRHSGMSPGEPVELEVVCREGALRVSVTDPGPGFEWSEGQPDPATIGGWGLYLVGEMVSDWHVEHAGGRTRVVADMPLPGRD